MREKRKNPAAVKLGSLGGQKRMSELSKRERQALGASGGRARAKKLSTAKRRAIAKAAVAARERRRAERQAKP